MPRKFFLLALIAASVFETGCLQTRAQLRADERRPAQVEDVPTGGRYILDEIKNEITNLNGRIEDLERAKKTDQDSDEKLSEIQSRLEQIEKQQNELLDLISKLQGKIPPPDPEKDLRRARAEAKDKDWDEALISLERYIKNPKSKRKREALFLRAESFYGKKDYKQAILHYNDFYEKYKKSKYSAKALYKIALSFEKLDMKGDAKAFFQELVDKHPRAPETVLAKRKIAKTKPKIKKKKPAAKKPKKKAEKKELKKN